MLMFVLKYTANVDRCSVSQQVSRCHTNRFQSSAQEQMKEAQRYPIALALVRLDKSNQGIPLY